MSSVYHTPYEDDVTQFKAEHMNVPLGELDAQIHTNTTAIAALVARCEALEAQVFRMSPSVSPSGSPSISASVSPSVSPSSSESPSVSPSSSESPSVSPSPSPS